MTRLIKTIAFPEGALLTGLAFATLFGLLAWGSHLEDSQFLRDVVATDGEIVAVRMRTEYRQKKDAPTSRIYFFCPVVQFYDASSRSVEFAGRYETQDKNRWKTGMRVPVLYPRTDPKEARINDPSQVYAAFRVWRTMAILSVIVGAALFGLGRLDAHWSSRRPKLTGEEAREAYFGG